MGFNVSEDEAWVEQYKGIWWRICEILHAPGCGGFEIGGSLAGEPLNNCKYINPKLIFWNGENRTRFQRVSIHVTSMRFPLVTLREF